jgi:hypothetical protein
LFLLPSSEIPLSGSLSLTSRKTVPTLFWLFLNPEYGDFSILTRVISFVLAVSSGEGFWGSSWRYQLTFKPLLFAQVLELEKVVVTSLT